MPITQEQLTAIQNLSPEQKTQMVREIRGEIARRQQALSPGQAQNNQVPTALPQAQPQGLMGNIGSRLMGGLTAGLKAMPYIIKDQIPPESTQTKINDAMALKMAERNLPLTQEEQAGLDLKKAQADYFRGRSSLSSNDRMALIQEKYDNEKELLELKRQNDMGDKTVEPKVKILQKQAELLDLKLKSAAQTPAKTSSVAQQKFDLQQEEANKQKEVKSQMVRDSAVDTLNTIKEIEAGIGNFGLTGQLPSIPGTSRAKWEANINKLLSGRVIDIMTKMKEASRTGATGFGQLSEKELAVLQQASTALKRNLSPGDAQEILNEMKIKLQKIAGGSADSAEMPNPLAGQTSSGLGFTIEE